LGFVISGMLLAAAGCAKTQAKALPDGPPLNMPVPPPHVIVAMEEPGGPPVAEETPAPAPPPAAAKPAPPAQRVTAKPEPKPEAPVAAAPEPRPVEPGTLKPGDTGVNERAIRERLTAASRDLGRIDYARLSAARRMQYEQSKRFVQQAEQAIKDQNYVFAATLADKAAALAAELVK